MNQHFFISDPTVPTALKMAIAITIGMLIGMERKWSHKETGIRTFAIISLLGMLATLIGQPFELAGLGGVLLLAISAFWLSSASTTTAAAMMASHGKISAAVAGSVAVISSLASAAVNLPIIWKTVKDKSILRRLTVEMVTVPAVGITVVFLDRMFEISEWLLKNVH